VNTSGDSSSNDASSFYGLNAAVVALKAGAIDMSGGSITTTGSGANGAFAVGEGSVLNLSDLIISATGGGAHGVMATQGGLVNLTNVEIDTAGGSSAPLATDRGSGTLNATNCNAVCSGQNSPAIYSTGVITVNGGTYRATGSEAAVIEGANSIILKDVDLSSTFADKWGVIIYQSMSGDAEGTEGNFTMTGGSLALTAATGPLFYVNNSSANINLTGVDVDAGAGTPMSAAAGKWGTSGSNGGTAILAADDQSLTGDVVADEISSVILTLTKGSSLVGAINADDMANEARLTLDATSTWNVTADSYLTSLTLSGGISGTTITNIAGNGHTVYYDAGDATNSALGGKTYNLSGGGRLVGTGSRSQPRSCRPLYAKIDSRQSPHDQPRHGGRQTRMPGQAGRIDRMETTANPRVLLSTSLGDITLELDAVKAPTSSSNFLAYAASGHFDGTIFHRVIPGFMIQGGGFTADMTQKATKAPITNEADNGRKNDRGTVAMARTSDPHSATSQFFISLENNAFLDHTAKTVQGWGYAVFGKVVEGIDVVDQIAQVPTGQHGPHGDVPQVPVSIDRVTVLG
jgi:cyclophilin family peptidyl-prolyl cis-trans isomerase